MKSVTTHPLRLLCSSRAPRAHLFTLTRLHLSSPYTKNHQRLFSISGASGKDNDSSSSSPSGFSFRGMPSPPRLPKEEQDVFESLQRQSTGAFSTPLDQQREEPRVNQPPDSSAALADTSGIAAENESTKTIEATGQGEELHPNVVRGAAPEFEGDVNPKTGEVGGPKNEPLRWGAQGEWTYNGRATDF